MFVGDAGTIATFEDVVIEDTKVLRWKGWPGHAGPLARSSASRVVLCRPDHRYL